MDATWVIGHPAARAVEILHRLQPDNTDYLFARLVHSPGAKGDVPVTAISTNNHLNELIDWINHYCHTHDRADGIPPVNNRTWRLSTRQFRRTLAWFIARRPGGAIAGAIAFRHHAIQMFEG